MKLKKAEEHRKLRNKQVRRLHPVQEHGSKRRQQVII